MMLITLKDCPCNAFELAAMYSFLEFRNSEEKSIDIACMSTGNSRILAVFREHEWDKHGTCSLNLDALNSELKYFTKGLELATQFDLLKLV